MCEWERRKGSKEIRKKKGNGGGRGEEKGREGVREKKKEKNVGKV